MTAGRAALVAIALAAGCGDPGGVLVDVTQADTVGPDIDTLHVFVGTPDDAIGGYAGHQVSGDVIGLPVGLRERAHTIQLVPDAALASDTPVRVAVLGKAQGTPVAVGVLDLGGVPSDVMLRYALELQPVDGASWTETGCLVLGDGVAVAAADDQDCDGVTAAGGDCDDLDPQRYPGAFDACDGASLGVDDDCSGTADDGDFDGDGVDCRSDCDDQDAARTPGALDVCDDGIDNDCDGTIDNGVPEICGDNVDNDCNPTTPDRLPDEICGDGRDNDCDGLIDEGRIDGNDVDNDGFDCAHDCDDDDEEIHPGAPELCNGRDDNCNHTVDEGANDDLDPAPCLLDCDDEDPDRFPGNPEVCDTVDNDCVADTHAAPRPCFDYTNVPCEFGFQACDETLGIYVPQCEPNAAGTPTPDGLCGQYASCETDPRGLACAGQPTRGCVQAVEAGGDVCAGATVPLNAPQAAVTCTWALLGGMQQQGWEVGLLAQGSTIPAGTVGTCQASFTVVSVPPGLQPGTFLVVAFAGGLYHHSEVLEITPQRHSVCPAPSLACTNTSGG